MDEIKQPGPLAEVEALYDATPRLLAFQARTREEFSSWHEELQAHVAKLLRVPEDPYPLRHYVLSKRQMEGYSRERVILKAAVGGVPLYVLRPDGDGPFRPVIALHGHGPGVRDAVGLQDGEEEEAHVAALNTGFAVSLVQRGFLVFAPEQLGFGERRDAQEKAVGSMTWSCRQATLALLLLGHSMMGLRVRDILRTLAYIATRKDARPGGVGGVGLSGGGTALLYAAALDTRLSALVLSGCFSTFRQSIMAINHCEDNYVPGILRYAEMPDIATLLAPRPLFVESGMDDPLFPASAAVAAFAQIRKAYALLGASEKLDLEVFAGGHRFHGNRSLDWLARRF